MHTVKWLNSSTWLIYETLTGTTTLGQSGPVNNSYEQVLLILHSSMTGASPSVCLVSYPSYGHSLLRFLPSTEMQSVYSTTPTDWATGRSLGKSYPSTEMQSVYSTAPADWATGYSLGISYPSVEMWSVYSTVPAGCVWSKLSYPK